MLELLAYTALLLVVMPALLLAAGKMIAGINATPANKRPGVVHTGTAASPSYDMLHERLNAAAKANPFLPQVFARSKGGRP